MKTRNIRRVLAMMLIASLLVGNFALTAGAATCNHTYVASRISNGNGTHTTINQCSKCGAIGATGTYVCTPGYTSYSQGSNYGHYLNTTCTVCYGIATSTFEACTLIAQPYTYTATHHTTSSYCPYCGNTYSGTYAHSLSTSTTYNTTHHQTTTGCYVCGYSNSMSYPHNLSTTTNSISSTQHQTVTACSGCGYNTTITGYHSLNTSTSSISATQHQTVTSCSGCNYTLSNTGNHLWSDSYLELNAQQHQKVSLCSSCGYSAGSQIEGHTISSTHYTYNNETTHIKRNSCIYCTYGTTMTENHNAYCDLSALNSIGDETELYNESGNQYLEERPIQDVNQELTDSSNVEPMAALRGCVAGVLSTPSLSVQRTNNGEATLITVGRPANAKEGNVTYHFLQRKHGTVGFASIWAETSDDNSYSYEKHGLASNSAYDFYVSVSQSGFVPQKSATKTVVTDNKFHWETYNSIRSQTLYLDTSVLDQALDGDSCWEEVSSILDEALAAWNSLTSDDAKKPFLIPNEYTKSNSLFQTDGIKIQFGGEVFGNALAITRINGEFDYITGSAIANWATVSINATPAGGWDFGIKEFGSTSQYSCNPQKYHLQSVLQHEVGHVLGLAHCHENGEAEGAQCRSSASSCLSNVMTRAANKGTVVTSFTPYDIASFDMVYLNHPARTTARQMNMSDVNTSNTSNNETISTDCSADRVTRSFITWAQEDFDSLKEADYVVVAQVSGKSLSQMDENGEYLYRDVFVSVTECLKGDVEIGATLTYREEGGELDSWRHESPDYPQVDVGQTIVLFLNADGAVLSVSPDRLVSLDVENIILPECLLPVELIGYDIKDSNAVVPNGSVSGVASVAGGQLCMSPKVYVQILREFFCSQENDAMLSAPSEPW